MIDPCNITDFERTDSQLEEFLLFCIVVAGKSSFQMASKINHFLDLGSHFVLDVIGIHRTPFQKIRRMCRHNQLRQCLETARMGQCTRIGNAFTSVAYSNINLRTCTVEDLERIPGIGPKTARFFVLHSRPEQNVAVLDTHILRFLGEQGHKVPRQTPSANPKQYRHLEDMFLSIARDWGVAPSALDLQIWRAGAKAS